MDWPHRYTARVLKNAFTDRWHNDISGLLEHAEEQAAHWKTAWNAGDVATANTFVGEATGLIDSVLPAGQIVESIVQEAEHRLRALS
mgnify:FL=1